MKRLLLCITLWLTFCLTIIVGHAKANTAGFSWLPNQDNITDEYVIYCSTKTVEELEEETHELFRVAPMDNIVDGRVQYRWEDFPANVRYNCVCVARGEVEGTMMTSDFSDEINFILKQNPDTVQSYRFDGVFTGTLTPID